MLARSEAFGAKCQVKAWPSVVTVKKSVPSTAMSRTVPQNSEGLFVLRFGQFGFAASTVSASFGSLPERETHAGKTTAEHDYPCGARLSHGVILASVQT
jgi:hypothetical protein